MSKSKTLETLGVEAEMLTVGQASKAGSVDVDGALGTIHAAQSAAVRVVGEVMWNAALLTHYVTETDRQIGKDLRWATQGDYMKDLGFSKAYGTGLKRLGRAAIVHGVKRGTAEWTFLASNHGNAQIGRIVATEDTGEFRTALKRAMAEMREHGAIAGPGRQPGGEVDVTGGEGTPGNGGADNGDGEEGKRAPKTVGDVQAILRALESVCHDMSDADQVKVERMFHKFADNLAKRRETLSSTVQGEVVGA